MITNLRLRLVGDSMKNALLFALSVGGMIAAQPSAAATLFESVPASSADFLFSVPSSANGMNYIAQFTLSTDVEITGFEIASREPVNVGDGIAIRLLNGATFSGFDDQIDAISSYDDVSPFFWVTSNFAPITLGPGTYYMGMSGDAGVPLDWLVYDQPGPSNLAYPLQGTDFLDFDGDGIGDQFRINFAFRVLGTEVTPAVPEPQSWLLMIAGMGLVGAAMRRRPAIALAL